MFQRWLHFSCRLRSLAAMLILLGSACGCTMWNKDFWNIDSYRDERAVDIDSRLQQTQPIVQNPF